jgi:hypothetical protein
MGPKTWLMGTCAAVSCLLASVAGAAEEWRRLETPSYTVMSQLDERDTRAWAAEFDLFVDSLTGVLGLRRATLPPLTVMLFADKDDLERVRPASLSAACLAGRMQVRVLGFTGDMQDAAARHAVFHAGVHWVTSASSVPQPRWFEEGVAELFSTFGVKGGIVHWGDPIGDHAALLRSQGLMPIRELLASTDGQHESQGDPGQYFAQSWALAHLLLLGGRPGQHEQLQSYLKAFRSGSEVEAFSTGFAGDYAGLEQSLHEYLEQPRLARGLRPREVIERKYIVTRASPIAVETALAQMR